jgi:hypothetical protein
MVLIGLACLRSSAIDPEHRFSPLVGASDVVNSLLRHIEASSVRLVHV